MNEDSGINLALLAALPGARNVLELGCATGRLGARYKHAHPQTSWTGVDFNAGALDIARLHLDRVLKLDLDSDAVSGAGSGFDLVVLGDVLEHLREPEKLLADLGSICTADAGLVCCIPNMSHISVIERMIRGDMMYDPIGLLDTTHLRFLSPRSAFKLLLDSGWLPDAAGGYQGGHSNARFTQAVVEAAQALGIPRKAAELNVHTYQLIVRCKRRVVMGSSQARRGVSVIVPGDDASQLDLNLLRSPGLREIDAEFVVTRGAVSAAQGIANGAARASWDWLLCCHDDVYFPRGTGFALLDILDRIAPGDAATTLLGFAGLGIDGALQPFRAGLIVADRSLRDFPATDRAIAIDDFAVLVHRSSPLTIDPELGTQLWATDLCLQSIYGPTARFPGIVRIPVLHNSVDDGSLSADYAASARYLAAKYPYLTTIPTGRVDINNDGTTRVPVFVASASASAV